MTTKPVDWLGRAALSTRLLSHNRPLILWGFPLVALLVLSGCGGSPAGPPPPPITSPISPPPVNACAIPLQRLRIRNVGKKPIKDLTVLFPGVELKFGNVDVGQTTAFVPACAVYGYAAYRYAVAGHIETQPVIDWVGESPLIALGITYDIDFDETRDPWMRIQQRSVDAGL